MNGGYRTLEDSGNMPPFDGNRKGFPPQPHPQIKLSLFNKIVRCEELTRIEKSFLKGVMIIGLGGFVLGYDVSVVAGGLEILNKEFHFDTYQSSLVVSSLSIGAAMGSIFAGPLCDSVGRWKICQLQAFLFVLGSCLVTTAQHFALFIVGRIIVGVGTAFAIVGSLSYLNEISPLKYSGRFQGAFELFGVFGMFFATLFNILAYIRVVGASNSWRWSFGITIFIGVCQSVLLFMLPESPSFLVQKGQYEKAKNALEVIFVDPDIVNAELESLKLENMTKASGRFETFIRSFKLYSPSLYVILGLVICQSFSGGIVFISYGPYIFSRLGYKLEIGLLATLALGTLRIAGTAFAVFRIDSRSWGRKQLLSYGILTMFSGYIAFIVIWFFCIDRPDHPASLPLYFTSLSVVVIGNALGFGAVTKVLQSEMFPTLIKSRGLSISLFVQSIFQFVILFTFPIAMSHINEDAFVFMFYGVFTLIGYVFVSILVPETLGFQPNQILQSIKTKTDTIACCKSKISSQQQYAQTSNLGAPLSGFTVDYDLQSENFRAPNDSMSSYRPPGEIEIGFNPLRSKGLNDDRGDWKGSRVASDNDDFIS